MLNEEIKYRQWIEIPISEPHFHYWGYVDEIHPEVFTMPQPLEGAKSEQYLGAWDCKGTDIYENDIVELEYIIESNPKKRKKRLALIEFVQTNLAFRACREDGFMANTNNFEKYKTKVVGNIHENPELYRLLQAQIKAQRVLVQAKNAKFQSERQKKLKGGETKT